MSLEKFADLYRAEGVDVEVDGSSLLFRFEEVKAKHVLDEEWVAAATSFFKAKQFSFDSERRLLVSYRSVEFQMVRLDGAFMPRPDHEFSDAKGNIVKLSMASPEFAFSLLASDAARIVRNMKRRARRRFESGRRDSDGYVRLYRPEEILVIPYAVSYRAARKVDKDKLISVGRDRVKSSLFKLAYAEDECWELRESLRSTGTRFGVSFEQNDKVIPNVRYKDDLVSYYKVAKSSQFAGQEFLSFYHILEYYFLRVSDEVLHAALKSRLNSPSFSATYENINKILAIIKKSDNSSDETEMLKSVLTKFVPEDDLIEFIQQFEESYGAKVYTDTKKEVFGEKAAIRLEKGHVIGNSARVIKVIRNSLVHSSDRYTRENCFMPFSESEDIVAQYVPLVKFMAEKVIFSTAE